MRYLLLVFWLCVLLLGVLLWRQQESNVFADGHLVCPPLPAALVAAQVPPMAPPPSGVLALLAQPRPVEPVCQSMKIKILEPPRESEQVTRLRVADQADWGIARMAEPTPVAVASLAHVRPVRPAPALVSASEVTSPTEVVPNLYLPEGALNEEGAMLTLIKPELAAFEEPSLEAKPAPFVMKAGERVRPLTRFRNDTDFDWVKFERDQKEWWAQAEYFIRVDPRNETSAQMHNLVIGQEAVDRDSALVPDYQPDDLVGVAHEYVLDGKELRLRREAAQALVRMIEEAKAQGLTLRVFSGFRGFAYQKKLYLERPEQLLGWIKEIQASKAEIGSLSRLVYQAYEQGDEIASQILHEESTELAEAARAVAEELFPGESDYQIVVGGGNLRKSQIYFSLFQEAVSKRLPGVEVIRPKGEPVEGAVIYALESVNKPA